MASSSVLVITHHVIRHSLGMSEDSGTEQRTRSLTREPQEALVAPVQQVCSHLLVHSCVVKNDLRALSGGYARPQGTHFDRRGSSPNSLSLSLAAASQPLLACGLRGEGCRSPSTWTSGIRPARALRALCSASRPTPTTSLTPSSCTCRQRVASQIPRSCSRCFAGSSAGVRLRPLGARKSRGHRLWTKQ